MRYIRKHMSRNFIPVAVLAITIATVMGCDKKRGPTFKAFWVRVIDTKTLDPVAGAKIRGLCMGGTTYATNIYVTNTKWPGSSNGI